MRKKIVIANWKMNGSLAENQRWYAQFLHQAQDSLADIQLVVVPSYVHLAQAQVCLDNTGIFWGVQDIAAEASGAYTGQVSVNMIKEFNTQYVLVGHSERRMLCHEDDNLIAHKTKAALDAGLTAVLCVGETLEHRKANKTNEIVAKQVDTVLELCKNSNLEQFIIAYEPVWAIGTGVVATPEQAEEVHKFIRERLTHCLSPQIAAKTRIIYGGSVKPDNAAVLFAQANIDGGLIGGASLDPLSFFQICSAIKR